MKPDQDHEFEQSLIVRETKPEELPEWFRTLDTQTDWPDKNEPEPDEHEAE